MINYSISSKIFNKAYRPYLKSQQDIQIFYGGSGSGKSFYLAQRCILDVINSERNYLICRKVQRTLKKSVFNELIKTIELFKMESHFTINKSDGTFTCSNGNQILLAGLDDTEKIKSITPAKGVITDIWIEEATETEREDVLQLQKRLRGQSIHTKRMILSFNPIYQTHWIYKEYFGDYVESPYISDNKLILKTTYKDNSFLTQQDVTNMESEKDSYFYNVYTLGNWGTLGKLVFTNWTTEKIEQKFDTFYNGLDFGFAVDPVAFVRCAYHKPSKTIYILDEFEELEMSNEDIGNRLKEMIDREQVICDSAEPKSIKELRTMGVSAVGAKKGKGSVNFGIDWIKRQTIVINHTCVNVKRELELYQYGQDKNGIYINKPNDKDNHLIDALRYALEELMENEQAIYF
jgi:phage terminase large subunit